MRMWQPKEGFDPRRFCPPVYMRETVKGGYLRRMVKGYGTKGQN